MTRFYPRPSGTAHQVVRLVRRWVASEEVGAARIPSLVALGKEIGLTPMAAVALASMFQLLEASLERRLEAECCCSPNLAADERMILALIAASPARVGHPSEQVVVQGLSGALLWSIASVQTVLETEGSSPGIANAARSAG